MVEYRPEKTLYSGMMGDIGNERENFREENQADERRSRARRESSKGNLFNRDSIDSLTRATKKKIIKKRIISVEHLFLHIDI